MQYPPQIRIGTRSSPLALWQAEDVKRRLLAAHPALAESTLEIVPFTTTGDKRLEVSLYDIGGKGLFTKELEDALEAGAIDMAVHSLKDVTAALPEGMVIGAMIEREDPRDGLVCSVATSLAALPEGARLGSASPRRGAQVRMQRPDIQIVHLRGNVATRLAKINEGMAEATLLAMAGLKRLGIAYHATPLTTEEMLPAIAQGTIGVECRASDEAILSILSALTHQETAVTVGCERVLLAELEGSCRTPLAGYATRSGDTITLRALIATPDGSKFCRTEQSAPVTESVPLAREVARHLRLEGKDILCHA